MKDYFEEKIKLMGYLKELDVSEKVAIINNINNLTGDFDDFIVYDNDDEFFNIFFYERPHEAVRALYFGDFRYSDDYICFNAYGNLKTYSEFDYNKTFNDYYLEDVAEWLLENVDRWDYLNIDLEEDEYED